MNKIHPGLLLISCKWDLGIHTDVHAIQRNRMAKVPFEGEGITVFHTEWKIMHDKKTTFRGNIFVLIHSYAVSYIFETRISSSSMVQYMHLLHLLKLVFSFWLHNSYWLTQNLLNLGQTQKMQLWKNALSPVNRPGRDRTGDEDEQTEIVHWHVASREETHWLNFKFPSCWEETTWDTYPQNMGETITEDRRASNITHIDPTDIDPTDKKAWRTAIKEMNCPTPQSWKNGL